MATQLYRPHRLGLVVRPIIRFASNFYRPSPPSLPPDQQREFEELQRAAQNPLAHITQNNLANAEAEFPLHPDAPQPIQPEFEGDIHPATGERGGPKREPVGKWGSDSGGDWSFKGRVSDF